MYAKHNVDDELIAKINKVEGTSPIKKTHRRGGKVVYRSKPILQEVLDPKECNSGRELILEDGTKQCQNCSDCPKVDRESQNEQIARIEPVIEVERQLQEMDINKTEVELTALSV